MIYRLSSFEPLA